MGFFVGITWHCYIHRILFYCLKQRFISWNHHIAGPRQIPAATGWAQRGSRVESPLQRQNREVQTADQSLMTIEGARLFVRAMDGPEGDLPPLLALYGAPGDQTHECSQAAFCFPAHEGHVIVFDARGNGASDGRPPLTHERWVRDVDELRAALGVETIVLAGHSYSGWSDYWADS
jgi:hypothetical protein